jgi:hypothetical protein
VIGDRQLHRLVFATLEPAFPAGAVRFLAPTESPGSSPEAESVVRGSVSTRRDRTDEDTAAAVERTLRAEPRLVLERPLRGSFVIRRLPGDAGAGPRVPLTERRTPPPSSSPGNPPWPWARTRDA